MIQIRKSNERGHANHGWLDSFHTFSFADYYDPGFMGFRTLRVINEDVIAKANGFGTHPHRDMEIITYVMRGELEHKDSMGTGSVIRPGDVQRMSAGTGVKHSEFNHSQEKDVHLLQIWILPEANGLKPSYEQKSFPLAEKKNRLRLVASRDSREGSILVQQDADLFASVLDQGKEVLHELKDGRHAWIQVVAGTLDVNGKSLAAGDGAAVANEKLLSFKGKSDTEFLLFDLN
jgi:redox-sensitive bicupin YhaK (pirin superfamily)